MSVDSRISPVRQRLTIRLEKLRTLHNTRDVHTIEGILHHQDLDRAQGGMDVRIVVRMRSEATYTRHSRGQRRHAWVPTISRLSRERTQPASSSQQLITKSIISSRFSAFLCFIIQRAVKPQYIAFIRRWAVRWYTRSSLFCRVNERPSASRHETRNIQNALPPRETGCT